ncbi:MAG: Dodecaprenyl-phosphate galacturonate synthase [Owenweeksia sp. TMED14]|nr:MAG: Dodecaprenyl-phosphate galacturonate synthase [Owenweeksia sp. TMED14]
MTKYINISIVIPLLNEEESLPELTSWIDRICLKNNLLYEIIFIDDGSTDESWNVILGLEKEYSCIQAIRFRRNHGKSAALHTGFQQAIGKVVVTMDADLQDSPDEIPELVRRIHDERLDLISGWKKKRFDPISKTLPTKLFNWAARKMSGIDLHDFNCGLKAYKLDVVKNIEVQGEMHRYIPVLAKMSGYENIGEQVVQHQARKYGTTKFGLNRFINGMLDLITLSMVSRFQRRPMHFFGAWGIVMFLTSGAALIAMGMLKLYRLSQGMKPGLVADDPWFYIFLIAMVLGTQLFVTGLLAELMVRQSNKKVKYSISDSLNSKG